MLRKPQRGSAIVHDRIKSGSRTLAPAIADRQELLDLFTAAYDQHGPTDPRNARQPDPRPWIRLSPMS